MCLWMTRICCCFPLFRTHDALVRRSLVETWGGGGTKALFSSGIVIPCTFSFDTLPLLLITLHWFLRSDSCSTWRRWRTWSSEIYGDPRASKAAPTDWRPLMRVEVYMRVCDPLWSKFRKCMKRNTMLSPSEAGPTNRQKDIPSLETPTKSNPLLDSVLMADPPNQKDTVPENLSFIKQNIFKHWRLFAIS